MEWPIGEVGENASEREQLKEKFIALAKELCESGEVFVFPGIDPDFYSKLKEEEKWLQESGCVLPAEITPIDELIRRFEEEGIKVALGSDPDSGNVFIVPAQSGEADIIKSSVFPKHLQITTDMDERLAALITMSKELWDKTK